jgi:superfamily II DNA/RNA helicase
LAPIALFGKTDQERQELMDAWWTMIVYHGSLRSVGNSQNELLYHSAERMKSILKRLQLEPWYEENVINNNATPDRIERLSISQITGNKTAEENSITFQNLEDNFNHNNSIDVTLATNMISVGLDVSRLSLMVINGQPLTTAEYIQSSSRVGRSEVPGVIFTNYYKHQARSLSHYENFRPYHEAFYRFVEPTSVTPYTKQARKRALHAALVIVMRHSNGLNLNSNNSASKFNSQEPKIARAIENLRKRCNQAILEVNINEQAKLVNENISQLVNDWENKILEHSRNGRPTKSLHYEAKDNDKSAERLLQKYDAKIKGLWATLDSMRNVEDGALMQSTGPYSPPSHGAIEK